MTPPLGAGKQSKLMAISVVSSFNYVNSKRTRVRGFTLVQTLDNAEGSAEKTTFNGQPAYLLDQTTQPTCTGDEAGWAGGVKSGTVSCEVKPTSGSSSILVEGKQLVRHDDSCTMNNGNVVGKYSVAPIGSNSKTESSKLYNSEQPYEENMTDEEIQAKVAEIRENYEKMISNARSLNQNFAADNLQYFIDGKGGTKSIPINQLMEYKAISEGEARIKKYIQDRQLQRKSGEYILNDDFLKSNDYWIADIKEYNPYVELSYASGASKIRSDVEISLKRSNNGVYTGSRIANFRWYDHYDWNKDQSFYIPFSGRIKDNDGIFLKEHGNAADFLLESKWQLSFEGEYNPKTQQWKSFIWKD